MFKVKNEKDIELPTVCIPMFRVKNGKDVELPTYIVDDNESVELPVKRVSSDGKRELRRVSSDGEERTSCCMIPESTAQT
jgi:hypothetical protein